MDLGPISEAATGLGQSAQYLDAETTIGVFWRQVATNRDRPAIMVQSGSGFRPVSWDELGTVVARTAVGLMSRGVRPRRQVAILSENRLEWVVCDLAIQTLGAVSVPIYPSSTADQVMLVLEATHCAAVIASTAVQVAKVIEHAPRLDHLHLLVVMDAISPVAMAVEHLAQWWTRPVLADELEQLWSYSRQVKASDIATIIPTSGTLQRPKQVMLVHRNFTAMAQACLAAIPAQQDDVILSYLPLAHVFERMNGLFLAICSGSLIYLLEDITKVMSVLPAVRPTLMLAVPRVFEKVRSGLLQKMSEGSRLQRSMFESALAIGSKVVRRQQAGGSVGPLLWLSQQVADRLVLGRVRRLFGGRLRFVISGGAPLSPDIEEFFWACGIRILQGYGLTETTAGATLNLPDRAKLGTVGRALPGVEIRIDETGEVEVKGPGVMLGYFGQAEITGEVLSDGWLQTGDLGSIDADGYLTLGGRKDDLIISSWGKNIAPSTIEAYLLASELVDQVCVLGSGRKHLIALIVPNWSLLLARKGQFSGRDPVELTTLPEVMLLFQGEIDRVNGRLASFEQIKRFALLPDPFSEAAGEVTPTLKQRRRILQRHYAELIERLYEEEKPDQPNP